MHLFFYNFVKIIVKHLKLLGLFYRWVKYSKCIHVAQVHFGCVWKSMGFVFSFYFIIFWNAQCHKDSNMECEYVKSRKVTESWRMAGMEIRNPLLIDRCWGDECSLWSWWSHKELHTVQNSSYKTALRNWQKSDNKGLVQ